MSYNCHSVFYIQASYSAGVAIGSLRCQLARNEAGELHAKKLEDGIIEIEVSTHNPALMSYIKHALSAFV